MWNDFLSLFFPRICVACNQALAKGEHLLCLSCDYKMAKTDLRSSSQGFLAAKFFGRLHVEQAWAYYLFNKHARIQQLLHKMKYHNMPELGEMVGEKLGLALSDLEQEVKIDVIVPVPLHKSKLKRRGYNQSEHFANGLAKHLNCDIVTESIMRINDTETQTRKSRVQRWRNVSDIFKLQDSSHLKGRNVLLVDDVITTGSTIEACGQSILKADINSLSVAAMAAAK